MIVPSTGKVKNGFGIVMKGSIDEVLISEHVFFIPAKGVGTVIYNYFTKARKSYKQCLCGFKARF